MELSHLLFGLSGLQKRQNIVNDNSIGFWSSGTGEIARWCIGIAIILCFVSYFVIGHRHGKRRIDRGLPPLWYHRWLVQKHLRLSMQLDSNNRIIDPMYNAYRQDHYYAMHPIPPPVYDPNAPAPPSYQPPAAKPDSSLRVSDLGGTQAEAAPIDEEHAAPLKHPAYAAVSANQTGSTSTSNNPYRT